MRRVHPRDYELLTGETARKPTKRKSRPLTAEEVAEIRRRYRKGLRGSGSESLAQLFGVPRTTIALVIKGKYTVRPGVTP